MIVVEVLIIFFFFFSSRRRHTRLQGDWSSDVCSSDLTFDGTLLGVESHLFDFSRELTKGRLEVRFWERLRDEQKFSGPAELRSQIAADLHQVRDYFRRRDLAATQPVRS